MKKFYIFSFIFFSCICYSQSAEFNRALMRDLLNDMLIDKENRDNNFYNKEDNLMYDITFSLDANYPSTKEGIRQADNIIFEQCKEDMYFYVETIFDMDMLMRLKNDCKYKKICFQYVYRTLDYNTFKNNFYIDIVQLINIRLNLNKKDFLSTVNYVSQ